MKKLIIVTLMAVYGLIPAMSQEPVNGATYFLPKTAVKFKLLIEKSTYTPGEMANYASRYMKLSNVGMQPQTHYRLVQINFYAVGLPDSTKQFTALIDKKHSIINLDRDENGVLMAVNDKAARITPQQPFRPAPKTAPDNPRDFFTEDILAAANEPRMAELIAQEITDIRESRNLLTRGEAEFMPKDGEQLKIMLAQLARQEKALLQVFQGTTQLDTLEQEVTFIPQKDGEKSLVFRFSKHYGLVDADDLSGKPYFAQVEDLHTLQTIKPLIENDGKKSKDDCGIAVNLPGKIKITLLNVTEPRASFELYAAQFGRVEPLSGELFGKKFTTHLLLDSVTGNVKRLETEPLDK
ncbi:DUF4831 family protein [Prevotella sp. A2931]|uniref:DUF4831 family protein n=1 Tax=Prevotella illustrans TaxID=2800387 RepID=A0ABS3M4N6_9BACT|nr:MULTISPECIES: DUF4831 family protein [Prevotella]MBO1363133.1 DUF4831 family protein [Prevotella illustrans]PTL26145.1 DUF4831 domain-containing protein [Prevotella sp. oral taxon 820]